MAQLIFSMRYCNLVVNQIRGFTRSIQMLMLAAAELICDDALLMCIDMHFLRLFENFTK